MSKAIIVTDFAYKGPARKGRGTGKQGLRAVLKYLQYRDTRNNHLAQDRDYERWHDHGMGVHYHEILQRSDELQSKHVLAWTWVVSPAPDLMALVPDEKRRDLVCDLTERIVHDYYTERGFDLPEFSYVLHSRMTEPEEGGEPLEHLHTHVILPGTAPTVAERLPVYNNKERGHDALFREIASQHFSAALDELVGPEWRKHREGPELTQDIEFDEPAMPSADDLDAWFPR